MARWRKTALGRVLPAGRVPEAAKRDNGGS
jgi:hypothetical protein